MSAIQPTFEVFPNGTSFMVWYGRNCDRCWKSKVNEATGKSHCAIEYAIAVGSVSDGTLLAEGMRTTAQAKRIADRLGWDGISYLETDCPERKEKRPKQSKRKPKQQGEELFK